MSDSLAELRHAIDALDQQVLALLNERALLAEQVGAIKRREGPRRLADREGASGQRRAAAQ